MQGGHWNLLRHQVCRVGADIRRSGLQFAGVPGRLQHDHRTRALGAAAEGKVLIVMHN